MYVALTSCWNRALRASNSSFIMPPSHHVTSGTRVFDTMKEFRTTAGSPCQFLTVRHDGQK